jgi:choline monooxygenase
MSDFDPTLPLERARTIPSSWYRDPSRLEAERRRVFGRSWLLAGPADWVARPGSHFTADLAGEPVVVTRDEAGALHALSNVCRHRGARVACQDHGEAKSLRCRYHGWTYTLDGRLIGLPEFAGVEEFRKEDNPLPPLRAEQWGPLIWVALDRGVPPLKEWLEPLERFGMLQDMAGLAQEARREYYLECDWKVFCDNYLDGGYHVNTLHPGLAGVLDYSQYRTELGEYASVQISPLEPGEVGDVRGGKEARYAWAFPHAMINLYGGVMDTNTVFPEGPGRCRVVFDFFFAPEATAEFKKRSMEVAHQVQLEDEEICAEVQRGLGSQTYSTGRFSVKREAGGYHFHRLLARWLG